MLLALMAVIDATFWTMVGRHEPPRMNGTVLGDIQPGGRQPAP